MTPIPSSDPVFRFSEVGEPLCGRYTKPVRSVPPPTQIAPWRDLSEDEARSAVLAGSSLMLSGAPGTGKTFYVRQLILALREQGLRVDVIAKTHAATQNIGVGAQTADHWVRMKVKTGGSVPCDVLVVEEITMMDVQLWADVCKLRLSQKASCILSGDFAQFPAILEHWCGTTFAEGKLEESHMVRDLAGSNRLTLSVNRRSDEVLFDFYTAITSMRPIAEAVQGLGSCSLGQRGQQTRRSP